MEQLGKSYKHFIFCGKTKYSARDGLDVKTFLNGGYIERRGLVTVMQEKHEFEAIKHLEKWYENQ